MKKRKEEGGLALKLPTEKSVPSDRLQDYCILLYGAKKIGKTQLTAQFESCMQMMFEPGAKAIEGYQVAVPSWKHARKYVRLLESDDKFQNVSFDTTDIAHAMCTKFACEQMGIDHPSDEEWGKGWQAVRDEFSDQIHRLLNTGKGVIFISHAAEKEIKTRHGKKYDRLESTMTGAARNALEALVDIWVCVTYNDDGDRIMIIEGDDYVAAGHRCRGHFEYTDGTPIAEIPMGESPEEAHDNFVAAFSNELENPEAAKKKATPKSGTKHTGLRLKKRN